MLLLAAERSVSTSAGSSTGEPCHNSRNEVADMTVHGAGPLPPDGLRRRVAARIRALIAAWIDADGSRKKALAEECASHPELITLRHIYYSIRYNRRPPLGDGVRELWWMAKVARDTRQHRVDDHDDAG